MRTTVQIVEIVDGQEVHVKKLTFNLDGQAVLGVVQNALSEYLVRRRHRQNTQRKAKTGTPNG